MKWSIQKMWWEKERFSLILWELTFKVTEWKGRHIYRLKSQVFEILK